MTVLRSRMRAAMLVVVLGTMFSIGVQPAAAATVTVGTCTGGVRYPTITAAISAVSSGSTIRICPGTYKEQLTINENLTLNGLLSGTLDGVILTPPDGGLTANATSLAGYPIDAHIAITGPGVTVNLNNIVVDSYGNGNANPVSSGGTNVVGILYQNANGTANHVTTRNQIADEQFNGDQGGFGFFAESNGGNVVTLENSSIHDYNKNGVVGSGTITLNVLSTFVMGVGPTAVIAQNGIELISGATGKISANHVSGHRYTGDGYASSGILLYGAANGTAATPLTNNHVTQNDLSIALYYGGGYTVTGNQIGQSTYEGIDICSTGHTVSSNRIYNSGESGIDVEQDCSSYSNTLKANTVVDACAGVLGSIANNTITSGVYSNDVYTTLDGTSCPPVDASALTASTARISTGPGKNQRRAPNP
jgi:hypothetical protein